jgi:hypothetical protein
MMVFFIGVMVGAIAQFAAAMLFICHNQRKSTPTLKRGLELVERGNQLIARSHSNEEYAQWKQDCDEWRKDRAK